MLTRLISKRLQNEIPLLQTVVFWIQLYSFNNHDRHQRSYGNTDTLACLPYALIICMINPQLNLFKSHKKLNLYRL